MVSPTHPYAQRLAPPVRPSRSLEGLERVIPPTSSKNPYFPTRSELFLNKPLPAKPLPEAPTEEYCAMWSDTSDSDSQSTVDSINSPSEPRISSESYPIFVSSGSDDFTELVDHPPNPADRDSDQINRSLSLGPVRSSPQLVSTVSRTDSMLSVPATESSSVLGRSTPISVIETQYGRPSAAWSQNRTGTNHYFREKKWDFFPELATPSALQASGRASPGIRTGNTRRKDGRLNLAAKRRWHSLDRAGMGLAHGVRDSIRTYVQRTLSKDSSEKSKESKRPVTAPTEPPYDQRSFQRQHSRTGPHSQSSVDLDTQLRAMSFSTVSMGDMPESPRSIRTQRSAPAPRQKQLAVPMSEYQKYGPSIWDSPKKSKQRSVRRTESSKLPTNIHTSSPAYSYANPTPPLSPPFKLQLQQNTQSAVRVLQGGTSHVLVALDGAKKKIIESKEERRREALKSQIKLVGPINPHDCLQADPWL